MKEGVLFLLGLMRSGTTYFRNVLSANRNIQVLGSELNRFWTDVARSPCGTLPECPERTGDDATAEIRSAVRDWFHCRYRNRNASRMLLYRAYRIARYGNETLIKSGEPFFLLNKSTHLINKIRFLNVIFPEARFIFLVRDVHSHANSLYRHFRHLEAQGYRMVLDWGKSNACWSFQRDDRVSGEHSRVTAASFRFEEIPKYWLEHNLLAVRSLDHIAQGRVLYLRYEDLVGSLPAALSRVEDLLQTKLNRRADPRLVNNYTSNPLADWRSSLTNRQIESINILLSSRRSDFERIYSFFDGDLGNTLAMKK